MSGGQWIQQVTLGWLLYDLTGSSVLLGLLNGLRALPFLIASPIAGVAADRMDRKQLILATQYVLIMTTLAMGLLVASGIDRKSTRLNSSHRSLTRMPSSA